jgi:ABC-type Fe3+-hydroxamate transport system substrate-binding protein
VVTIRKHPERALVNYTSFIEPWYARGGPPWDVPDTKKTWRSFPPTPGPTSRRPVRPNAPNIEKILALEPDLVVLAAGLEKQRALEDILEARRRDAHPGLRELRRYVDT